MSTSASILKAVRLTHFYVGVFVAPAVLFFAVTGALQTFSLHETSKGSDYKPPQLFVVLAQIHKKQTSVVPSRKPLASTASSNPGAHPATPEVSALSPSVKTPVPDRPSHSPLPMKIFFLTVSTSLCVSTFSGIYMSWKYTRNKVVIVVVLLFGAIVPLTALLI